jgi:hypothetical protein
MSVATSLRTICEREKAIEDKINRIDEQRLKHYEQLQVLIRSRGQSPHRPNQHKGPGLGFNKNDQALRSIHEEKRAALLKKQKMAKAMAEYDAKRREKEDAALAELNAWLDL